MKDAHRNNYLTNLNEVNLKRRPHRCNLDNTNEKLIRFVAYLFN